MAYVIGAPAILVALIVLMGFRQVYEYQRGVVFRLGRYAGMKGPGLKWIIPFIDTMVKVDLRTIARDVPPQDIITKDNVTVQVNAVVFMRVMNPDKAILEVDNYLYNTSQLAQTHLRSILGEHTLDELLTSREKSTLRSRRLSMRTPTPGASRLKPWKSSTLTFPPTCKEPWPRKPKAKGKRRIPQQ